MLRSLLLTIALLGAALVGAAMPADAAGCPRVTWGSLEKANLVQAGGEITRIRAGQDGCFDRLVFDISGPLPGYDVSYVNVVHQEATGNPLVVPGGARLQVVLFDNDFSPRTPSVAGFSTLRSVVYGGSFEAVTVFGVGTRARLPFRVFTLTNPNRVVLDVARSWVAS